MIKFEKVSYDIFYQACKSNPLFKDLADAEIRRCYDEITLPKRSSVGSAGYDFYYPLTKLAIEPHETFTFPTGIRATMPDDIFLMIVPRSGFGFKTSDRLANSVGVIDASYYSTPNEGHIMCKIINQDKHLDLEQQDRLVQGIFLKYYATDDDNVTEARRGGFGSSGK